MVGQGPVRTGVTVVCPRGAEGMREPVFAGFHSLNGNGEMTGVEWVRESGLLTTPIALTNTHSVGVVRDALVAASVDGDDAHWSLPVVSETFDGLLNDMNGFHVQGEHLHQALAAARGGRVEEGAVGGGTGSVCHEFKGGIGTASRVVGDDAGGHTVGVLVQANYGKRDWLRIDGVRVGEAIPVSEVPSPYDMRRSIPPPGSGSIVVVIATDAPLLPHQCARLAQRAGLGIARVGGTGGHTSGDLFIAFATGNRIPRGTGEDDHPIGLGTYDGPGGRRHRHRSPVRCGHRGDRGGDRQRVGRCHDGGRAGRDHGLRDPAPPTRGGDAGGRAVIVRPASDADIPAITAILEANDEPVSWPDVPRPPYVEHLLTRPRTRVVVGELDGTVAGLAASIEFGAHDRRIPQRPVCRPGTAIAGSGSGDAGRGVRRRT